MPKKSRKNVGLIGLGIIGSRVAEALRVGGFRVYVWNRTPRAAPNFLASPRQIAELCDIIQIFVADAQALFDVLEAMGDSLSPSHIILCNATVGPEATIEAGRIVRERGAQYLDAPFTGSKAAAQNRELVYYIGGEDKTFQAVENVLKASSKTIIKVGKIGDASVIKVATNMISAVTVQTLAEAYAIVKESGIEPKALGEALKHHAVRSAISDTKLAKIIDRDYETHFSLKHMFKDVQLGIHIANSLDIDLPATTATAGVMYGGLTRGWADEDFAVLGRTYQKDQQPAPLPEPAAPKAADKAPQAAAPVPPVEKVETPQTSPQPVAPPASEPKLQPSLAESAVPAPLQPAPSQNWKPAQASALAEPKGPDAASKEGIPGANPSGANGAPGEDDRPRAPFVRIRRWFGTGTPS